MRFNLQLAFSGRTPASRPVCLAFALALILLLFGDVLFLHTSLAPFDYDQSILARVKPLPPPRSIFPEREGRSTLDGQADLWSGSAQFEPAMKFMAFCLRSGESPYWDPYSAAGSLGPEVLVDLKFSPITLVSALFGGSAAAFSFSLIGLFVLSAYCILRTFTTYLELSLEAALAAAAIFFLNGFALANFDEAIGQPYFLAPLVLHAMLIFTNRQIPWNAVLAVAATTALLATTFTPTAVLALIAAYSISLSLGLARTFNHKRRLVAIHVVIPSISLLLLAFLYLPIFDAFSTYLHTLADYNSRRTPGISLINLLSLFTPKHFWESYFAMKLPATAPAGPFNKYTFHLGLIGPLIAVHCLSRIQRRTAPIILAAAACFSASVGQIFGTFPFTLIDSLPFFSFVMNDYWPCMTCLSLMVLVAYGYDAISDKNAFNYPCVLLLGVIISSFFFLYGYLGLYDHFTTGTDLWTKRYLVIFGVIMVVASLLLVLSRFPRLTRWTKHLLLMCLIAEGVFYTNGLRPYRSNRDVELPELMVWLKSAVDQHPGSRVLNIGRNGIFPSWGSAIQIPQLEVLSQFWMPWYETFFHRYIGTDTFLSLGASPATTIYSFTDATLSLVGVRYLLVDAPNVRANALLSGMGYPIVRQDLHRVIYENPHAMARSFAVCDIHTLDGLPSDINLSVLHSATTTDKTLLSQASSSGIPVDVSAKPLLPETGPLNNVQVIAYHHDRVRVRCDLKQAAVVVLMDSWNPRWSATIDRKSAYIGKVDVAFRGVAVAAGQHEVEFRYYPASRLWGQLISGITLIGLLVGFWFWSRSLGVTAAVSTNPADGPRPPLPSDPQLEKPKPTREAVPKLGKYRRRRHG